MRQCLALTKERKRCKISAEQGSLFCHKHRWWWLIPLSTIGALIVAVTTIVANISTIMGGIPILATRTPTPSQTLTLTLTPTLIPEADTLYYLFILDASARMQRNFHGSETKWESIRDSALNHLIYGLPERANYGLIVLGGNLPVSTRQCGDKNREAVTLGLNAQGTLVTTINNLGPASVASLADAIKLSRNILDNRQGNIQKKLFMLLGGGDDCSGDQWVALKFFLKDYKKGTSIDVTTEIVILPDESMDPELVAELKEDIKVLGLENEVGLEAPKDEQELQTVMADILGQTMAEAHQFEPEAVEAQQTLSAISTESPVLATANIPQASALPITQPVTIPTQVAFTPTTMVIQTLAPPPTNTQLPPPPSTNTPIPQPTFTPTPYVVLSFNRYIDDAPDAGCNVEISMTVTGSTVTGHFHVWNPSYGPDGDEYEEAITQSVGTITYVLGLGGNEPQYYQHEIWFRYNGIDTEKLPMLFCPNNPTATP